MPAMSQSPRFRQLAHDATILCLCAIASFLGLVSVLTAADQPSQPAVTVKVLDQSGLQALIASHKGKVVVVDVWATYCEPCLKKLPGLVELHKKYGGKVACVSLSMDYQGSGKPEDKQAEVLAVLAKLGATFDNVITQEDSEQYYGKVLATSTIPAVLVYDRSGKLVKTFNNDDAKSEKDHFSFQDVEAKVRELLDAPPR